MNANFLQYSRSGANLILLLALLLTFTSSVNVRALLSVPLVVHESNAQGGACYVLAGGGAIWERLDAAADLVQMGRVRRILLMQDNTQGQYSFKANASWMRTQWMADYLAWRGISKDKITWLPQKEGTLGTLTEARIVAQHLPKDVNSLVIVSSAPHMRRAVLAFQRVLSSNIKIIPYAATTFENSYEVYHPIWLEYLKLLIYFVVA